MSVILDALRKLDREKSSRRKGTANIAAEILRPDLTHPGKRVPVYLAIVVVAAIAAAAITYSVMLKFGFMSKPSPTPVQTVPPPSPQVAASAPGSAVPSKLSPPAAASAPVTSPRVTVRDAKDEASKVPPKVQSPAKEKERADVKVPVESRSPVTPVVDKKASQGVTPKGVDATPKKTPKPTPNVSATNPASMRVSAIVWYEDASRRFAMINGIMVTEGSSVEGVKVVEINPTSVRLLHDGQYFEISMSK